MVQIVVTFNDGALTGFASKLNALGLEGRTIMSTTLAEAGHKIRHATVVAETAQTGLKQGTLERAQHEVSSTGALTYTIRAHGGNISLKYFGAKEAGGGVTAHPMNKETFFAGAFMLSGRPGNRHQSAKLNGQVFVNEDGGKWRGRIHIVKSGVYIPTELTRGQTAAAFEAGANDAMNYVVTRLGSLMP